MISETEKNLIISSIFIPFVLAWITFIIKNIYISKLKIKANNTSPRLFSQKLHRLADGQTTTFNIYQTKTKTQKTIITPTMATQKIAGTVIRCEAVFLNTLESLCFYAPALIFSIIWMDNSDAVMALAIIYLIARIIYVPLYVFVETQKLSFIRSICFMFGLLATIGLYIQAYLYSPPKFN